MFHRHVPARTPRRLAAAAGALVLLSGAARAEAPFAGLNGAWSGGGTASFEGGRSERLSCKAYYSGGGTSLSLSLRCATASANINLHGSLAASGSRVHGEWSEASYGVSGNAAGSASPGSLRLRLSGGTSGTMVVSTSGASQSVSISTGGPSLRGVNVNLHKR